TLSTPPMLPTVYIQGLVLLVLSIATFVVYGVDKHRAKAGKWRVKEATLHILSVCGGWPGALCGMGVFRHKTQKQPFRTIFWVTVVVNVLENAWVLTW
ncbi:protein of unknown function DUF1294, partial [Kipferlia bialata]